MSVLRTPIRLTGATVLRDGILQQRTIGIDGGRIARGAFPAVDLSGYVVLPGIVDLHHSGLTRRLDEAGDPALALARCDGDAAAHGVTTRVLSLPWSWERPGLSPEAAEAVAASWADRCGERLTDLRLALDCDTHMVAHEARLLDLVRRHRIALVAFSDRTRIARQRRDLGAMEFARFALQRGCSAERLDAALAAVMPARPSVPRHLCRLAQAFDDLGVSYGSLGDDSAETREHYSMIGARICLLPASLRAAAVARAVGDPVAASAAHVLPDRSARKPVPDLVGNRLCDILVSDQRSDAPLMAVRGLVARGVLALPEAWRMVSEVPADILRLPDRGVLAPGRRADLVILRADTLDVGATIAGGRIVHMTEDCALRFRAAAATRSQGVAAE